MLVTNQEENSSLMSCAPDRAPPLLLMILPFYIVLKVGCRFSSPKGALMLQMMEPLMEIIMGVVTFLHRKTIITRTKS